MRQFILIFSFVLPLTALMALTAQAETASGLAAASTSVAQTPATATASSGGTEKWALGLSNSKRRSYPGGRDEQDLTVQASIPVPSRNADIIVQTTPVEEDENHAPDHD